MPPRLLAPAVLAMTSMLAASEQECGAVAGAVSMAAPPRALARKRRHSSPGTPWLSLVPERASAHPRCPPSLTVREKHSLTRLGTPVVVCLAGVLLGALLGALMMRASPVLSLDHCTLSIALSGEADGPRRPGGQEARSPRRACPQQRARSACQPAAIAPLTLALALALALALDTHSRATHSGTGQRGAVLPDHGAVPLAPALWDHTTWWWRELSLEDVRLFAHGSIASNRDISFWSGAWGPG
ncbi:hypothetical protein N431DRAFT_451035 [Stipitochalara longipes BDJ]|nr:hypothetical protein N431DRAFT_451035 [Stipitochalara longipes BDJ]